MRTKQDYVLNQKDGKYIPEKVGLKAIQRDGVEYEFTIVFNVDSKHLTIASKDRTNLFSNKPEFKISESTGRKILDWCSSPTSTDEIEHKINQCNSLEQLSGLYRNNPSFQLILGNLFTKRKTQILETVNTQKHKQNGTNIS
jgi:hypothetical protein